MTGSFRADPPPDVPRPIGSALDRVVQRLGAGRGAGAATVGTVFDRWEELVGPQLAARTRPLALRDGTLVVGVDDPAWVSHVRYLTDDLIERIQAEPGGAGVVAIEVRVKPRRGRRPSS